MANYSTLHRRPWETALNPFRRATTYARIQDWHFPSARENRSDVRLARRRNGRRE